MAVTTDIVASYTSPAKVMRRLLALGQREDRALAFLMAACVIFFVARWPALAREAHLAQEPLNPMLGGALLAWIFAAPLLFYVIAFCVHWVLRAFGGQGTPFGTRLALFWTLLATTPLVLLNGLVAGFIGPGLQLQIVGLVWVAAFLLILTGGLRAAHAREKDNV
jgi:hypothetical protein